MSEPAGADQPVNGGDPGIAFVSRGHGRGHAVPDMAIADHLMKLVPDLKIQFISYAAGAEAYRARGYPVLDMRATELPPFLDMVVAFTRLFGLMEPEPSLIVAHEEFAVLTAAEILEIPCLFITDFFADPTGPTMQVMKSAAEIIFTAERGIYTEPPFLRGKIHYVGRAVRPFEYSLADRAKARAELNIPPDATVALMQPGAWVESRVPIAELVMAAWQLVPHAPKRLIWLAGRDIDAMSSQYGKEEDLILLREDWKIDRLMAASNVLITKANRLTVYEAAAMGLPSISVSTMANWPDDVAVATVESNMSLSAGELTPRLLADAIVQGVAATPSAAVKISGGVSGAAARIARYLEQLPASPTQAASA
jgi:hypothetical protein